MKKKQIEPPHRPEVPTKNGHYMGLTCGFEYQDGSYRIARSIHAQMDELLEEEQGISALIEMHNRFISGTLRRIQTQKRIWWDRVETEYGLKGKNMTYKNGWLSPTPVEGNAPIVCIFCGVTYKSGREAIDHRLKCEQDPFAIEIKKLTNSKRDGG